MPNERRSPERLEPPAVATRVVLASATGLMLFVGLSLVVMHFYYHGAIDQPVFVPPSLFAEPRLQTSDTAELTALRAAQRYSLQSYAWVDKEHGVIAIPIEEAMKRIAGRAGDKFAPVDTSQQVKPANKEAK